jgi:hypothetical protein
MNSLVPYKKGSLADAAGGVNTNPHKMAMALRNAELLILVDCSGSMATADAGDHEDQPRHEAAQECLDILQERFPGKVAIGAFNSASHGLVHTGILPDPAGGTPLHLGMDFFYPKVIAAKMKFVIYPIYCIYTGPISDTYRGREFLERLAKESGGEFDFVSLNNIKLLAGKIAGYLTAGPSAEPTAAAASS